MIVKGTQLSRALAATRETRLFLFYGPDESGSRALAAKVAAEIGAEAERIDLAPAELKNDPARLSDEAAAISMFGGPRYILVDRAGDEILPAVEGLLESAVAGDPVVILAGDLKKSSKLLKAAAESRSAVAFASYLPEGGKAGPIVVELARGEGLLVERDVAQRVAEACGGNRAVIEQEVRKFALYLGAAPDSPKRLEPEVLEAVGAGIDDGDANRLVDKVATGDARGLEAELSRLGAEGVEGISLLRSMLRRMALLAKLRAEVEQGRRPEDVMASSGKYLFWKEKDAVGGQLAQWRPELIARSVSRLLEAELAVKASGGIGPIAADETLFAICRQAARLR